MKHARPGKRFQDAHDRARHNGASSGWARVALVALALVFLVIGIILVFIPGPAFVFFILAGALLAAQWRRMARWLDQTEVVLRRIGSRLKNRWLRFRHSQPGP